MKLYDETSLPQIRICDSAISPGAHEMELK